MLMEAIVKFDAIEIPYIFEFSEDENLLVDRERGATGTLQQMFYGGVSKRSWKVSTRPLPYTTASAILSHLYDNNYEVDFWYDKLGAEESIAVVVDINEIERIEFPDRAGAGWTDDHIELAFTLTEI